MARDRGDLWQHLATEVQAVRMDLRHAYERMGRIGSVLGKVAAETRKRFDKQQAQRDAMRRRSADA